MLKNDRIKDYSLKNLIGKGASGVVCLTEKENSNEKFVTKIIELAKLNSSSLTMVENEVDILKRIDHKNIVKYTDFIRDEEHYFIIMEYINGCNLRELLNLYKKKFQKEKTFPPNLVRFIVSQICDALEYLHSNKIVHRDLKFENIMFQYLEDQDILESLENMQGIIKIIDFGFSRINDDENKMMTSIFGTPITMSPQIIDSIFTGKLVEYNYKTDLWSLGIIVYELFCGYLPFDSKSFKNLKDSLMKQEYYINLNLNISREMIEFIQGLLQTEPNDRYDWAKLRNTKYLSLEYKLHELDLNKIDKKYIRDEKIVLNLLKFNISNKEEEIIIPNSDFVPEKTVLTNYKMFSNNNKDVEKTYKNSDVKDLDKTQENIKFTENGKNLFKLNKTSNLKHINLNKITKSPLLCQRKYNPNTNDIYNSEKNKIESNIKAPTDYTDNHKFYNTNNFISKPYDKTNLKMKETPNENTNIKYEKTILDIDINKPHIKEINEKKIENNYERIDKHIKYEKNVIKEDKKGVLQNVDNKKANNKVNPIELKALDIDRIIKLYFDPINNNSDKLLKHTLLLEPLHPSDMEEFS